MSDPSGKPIELATLTVEPQRGGDGPVTQEANVTDAKGRYFVALPAGTWEVTVTAFGFEPVAHSVKVRDGERVVHDVVLQPTGA